MSLKIGLIKSSPTATPCALDAVCAQRGYAVEATLLVCQSLGLNCSLKWYDTTEYGDVLENGTGTGLVGAIQRGEYDTALPLFTPTYRRAQGLDFSRPCFFDDIVLVTRTPNSVQDDSLNLNMIYAFQWPVWGFLTLSLILSSIFKTYVTLKFNPNENWKPFSSEAFVLFQDIIRGLVTAKYKESLFEMEHMRVIAVIWCMASLVLTSAYTGGMFSQQVATDNTPPPYRDIKTFVECLEKDECRLITHSVSASYLQHFIAPGTEMSDRIQSAMKKNPMEVYTSQPQVMARIQQERDRYLVWFRTKFGILYATKGNNNCTFYIVDAQYQEAATFPVRKNSSKLLALLNRAGDSFQENGFDNKLESSYLVPSKCEGNAERNLDSGSIYAEKTYFVILMFGLLGACAGLAGEIVVAKRQLARDRHEAVADVILM